MVPKSQYTDSLYTVLTPVEISGAEYGIYFFCDGVASKFQTVRAKLDIQS